MPPALLMRRSVAEAGAHFGAKEAGLPSGSPDHS